MINPSRKYPFYGIGPYQNASEVQGPSSLMAFIEENDPRGFNMGGFSIGGWRLDR